MQKAKILKLSLIVILSIILIGLLSIVIFVNRKFTDDMAGYLVVAYERGITAEEVSDMLVEYKVVSDNLPEDEVESMEAFGVLNDLLLIVTDNIDSEVVIDIVYYGSNQKVSIFKKLKMLKYYGMSNSGQIGDTVSASVNLITTMNDYIVKYRDVFDRVLELSYKETELLINFTYDVVGIINYPESSSEEGQAEQLITILEMAGGDLTGLNTLNWIYLCTFIGDLNDNLEDTAELVSVISYILGYGYIPYDSVLDLALQLGDYFINGFGTVVA
ncbi:MAG: hypothetical protein R3Y23_04445 [Bacillota bacterium]